MVSLRGRGVIISTGKLDATSADARRVMRVVCEG